MKRFHVHLAVSNLTESISFYSRLFGQEPTTQKADYAKWMLEDPRLNFAISSRGHAVGVNHLGFQAENAEELGELKQRALQAGDGNILDEGQTTCCYSNSEKHWTVDPSGIAWEHYQTMSEALEFGSQPAKEAQTGSACCEPIRSEAGQACCVPATQSSNQGCCG